MLKLVPFVKSLLPSLESQDDRDNAFLAASVDLCDLERRMNAIEHRIQYSYGPGQGLYPKPS